MGITWPGANMGKSTKCGSMVSEAIAEEILGQGSPERKAGLINMCIGNS